MKVRGEAVARGSAQTVWGALHDAAVLARAIPGCDHLEVTGPGLSEFTAATALPAIGGTYAGKLAVVERQRPSLLRLTASATGDQGTITADVALRLSQADGASTTVISYEVNGTVTGPVASVGARLLASAVRRLADDFLAAVDECASRPAAEPAPTEPAPTEPALVEPELVEPELAALTRTGHPPGNRVALVAGVAIGLAGIAIGVLAGRRGRRVRT